MADNVAITAGSGTTVSTEEITTLNGGAVSAQHVQRVVPSLRTADGVAVDVNATNAMPVTQASGNTTTVTITRTADTNAYAANDVIGAATGSSACVEFTGMGLSGGDTMITGAELMVEASALISGETNYRLYLYSVTAPSALGDNAAFDLPSGDRNSFLGFIELGTPVDLGSTLFVQVEGINKHIKLAGTSIFAYLVTTTAYTPTSARVYRVTLHTVEI